MNERIINLRKTLEMTQEQFSNKIGIKRSTLSGIENGSGIITDRTIITICNVFAVNENWLRTGDGEMFISVNPAFDDFMSIFDSLTPTLQDFLHNVAIELLKAQDNLNKE